METIRIKVNNYYGNPSYYSVMPQEIFDSLELASLQGEEFAVVAKEKFDKMIVDYKKKMENLWKGYLYVYVLLCLWLLPKGKKNMRVV